MHWSLNGCNYLDDVWGAGDSRRELMSVDASGILTLVAVSSGPSRSDSRDSRLTGEWLAEPIGSPALHWDMLVVDVRGTGHNGFIMSLEQHDNNKSYRARVRSRTHWVRYTAHI